MLTWIDSYPIGKTTASADTIITVVVPPKVGCKTVLKQFKYTAAGTAHTLTVMRPFSTTTLSSAAAAAQAVINLTADPGTGTAAGAIAANDFVVLKKTDGDHHLGKVSSVSTLAITLTANVPTGGFAADATVWFLGALGDSHPTYALTASATTAHSDSELGIMSTVRANEPMVLHSGNATAAGTLDMAVCGWTVSGNF